MKSWMVLGLLILITYGLSPLSSLAMQKRDEIKFENLTI
jgi:hypothetical protein